MHTLRTILLAVAALAGLTDLCAQDNGLNPVFTVAVNDLQYNVPEKKATVGSVLGTIAQAAAGQATDTNHEEMAPAVNAAVKSAIGEVRRLQTADASATATDLELSGEITQITTTVQVRTVEEKDSKGKVHKRSENWYDGKVGVSLTLRDLATGEVKTRTFAGTLGFADTPPTETAAIDLCVLHMREKIVAYFNSLYPLSANIIEHGTEKKDKAKEMYIDLGAYAGTYKGQRFLVYAVGTVAGRETRSKIGRLKIAEVLGDDISLCKVTSGGKDIKSAFDQGKRLLVVSEE